jgi:hypothetical protein
MVTQSMYLILTSQQATVCFHVAATGFYVAIVLKAYLHGQWFSVSDATAASKDRNNPIFCAVLDAAVASDTEKHCPCK